MMVDLLVRHQVSSLAMTPTQVAALLRAPNSGKLRDWKKLRTVLLGGELVPDNLVREFYSLGLPNACLWNGYGKDFSPRIFA